MPNPDPTELGSCGMHDGKPEQEKREDQRAINAGPEKRDGCQFHVPPPIHWR